MGIWINAVYTGQNQDERNEIRVKQLAPRSQTFVDESGTHYSIDELDLTVECDNEDESAKMKRHLDEANKEFARRQVETQETINKMLASMDANAIADHKAKIDDRDYWRKLRGDIALEIIRKIGSSDHRYYKDNYGTIAGMTKQLFDLLFSQDVEFNEKISHDKE